MQRGRGRRWQSLRTFCRRSIANRSLNRSAHASCGSYRSRRSYALESCPARMLWKRYHTNAGSACEIETDAARSRDAQGMRALHARCATHRHSTTSKYQTRKKQRQQSVSQWETWCRRGPEVALILFLEMDRAASATDVNQFRVLNEDVLHFFLGNDGNDFLGLGGSDHDVLQGIEV